jgi:thiamine kinase-like enzyme
MSKTERKGPIKLLPEEWRRYVVSIHKVATELLPSLGKEPNNENIISFVKEARGLHAKKILLIEEAAKIRCREELELEKKYKGTNLPKRQIEDRVKKEIEERYKEIDMDPERNCSFLDEFLFTK